MKSIKSIIDTLLRWQKDKSARPLRPDASSGEQASKFMADILDPAKNRQELDQLGRDITKYKDSTDAYYDQQRVENRLQFIRQMGTGVSNDILHNQIRLNSDKLEYVYKQGATQHRLNSIYSEMHGIGMQNRDPVHSLDTIDVYYSSHYARHLFRTLDGVARIIETIAEDSVREGYNIELICEYEKESDKQTLENIKEALQERLLDLNIQQVNQQGIKYSNLFSRGVGVYPVIDGITDKRNDESYMTQPISLDSVEKLIQLNVVQDDRISYVIHNIDPYSTQYGKIEWFLLGDRLIHPSHLFLMVNDIDIYYQRGLSILDRLVTSLKGLSVAQWSITVLLIKYSIFILVFEARAKEGIWSAEQLQEQLRIMSRNMSSKSAMAMPDVFKPEQLSVNFSGIGEALDFIFRYISFVLGIPQSQITGSARGEISSADRDRYAYSDLVKGREIVPKLQPFMQKILTILLHEPKFRSQLASINKLPSDVKVKVTFNPLVVDSAGEQEKTQSEKSSKIREEVAAGILTKAEARAKLYPDLPEYEVVRKEIAEEQNAEGALAGSLRNIGKSIIPKDKQ